MFYFWLVVILIGVLLIIDANADYKNKSFEHKIVSRRNGSRFTRFNTLFWQVKKRVEIINRYNIHSEVTSGENDKYEIIRYTGAVNFIILIQLRFNLTQIKDNMQNDIQQSNNITIQDSKNISINFSPKLELREKIEKVHYEIKNNNNVNEVDKEFLLRFLEDFEAEKDITRSRADKAILLLKRYEPLINCISTIISAVSSAVSIFK